ncbi:MAG: TVP38/TMEM64 family protein [Elusimicrobia bacterium]|nr:TVP38/TMEM64 family protein [Elusimicrobiota bacterium]
MSSKYLIGLGVLGAIVGVYFFTPIRSYFTLEAVVRLVTSIKANPWAPIIFVVAYTASCVLAPISAFPVAGGVLFGFWKGFLLNTLAANVGAWITFFIARKFGREVVGKLMKGSLKTFDERMTHHGLWTIFGVRMVGFPPFLVANYAAGLSGVRVRDYVLGTFSGMLVWTGIFTYFADTLWNAITTAGLQGFQQAAGRFFWPVVGGFLILAVVMGMTSAVKKRMTPKSMMKHSGGSQ